jgi:predicted permease
MEKGVMLNIFFLVLPIFLILILGNLLIRFSLITADFISVSNRLVFYLCLPVLLFYQISTSQFNEVFSLRLILIMAAAVSVMFVLSFVLAFLLRYPRAGAGTFAMNNFRANYAYMGLPVCLSAYGDHGLAIGSIYMAFIVPYVNMLSVLSLAISGSMKFDLKLFLKNTLLNPIALSCLAGILFSIYSVPLPPFISKTLEIISGVTLPLALFAIGAGTNLRLSRIQPSHYLKGLC